MSRPIVVFPDPFLRTAPESTLSVSEQLMSDLKAVLSEVPSSWITSRHLGEFAPVAVIQVEPEQLVLIRPEIIELKGRFGSRVDSDLSFPGLKTSVLRRNKVLVRFVNEEGKTQQKWFVETWSRLIQQAAEQLSGKLMIDHVSGHRKRSIKGYLGRLEKGKFTAPYPTRSPILVDNE